MEYNMTAAMANSLLKAYRADKSGNKQKKLVEIVNQHFGLMYTVTKVNLVL
jgi:hypothetical protein